VSDEYFSGSPIRYRSSADGGLTWLAGAMVTTRTNTADSAIGLTSGGAKRRFVSHCNATAQLEIFASDDGTTFTPVFTSNEPNHEHDGSLMAVIGSELHTLFVGPQVSGAGVRPRIARVVLRSPGFGAIERLEDAGPYGTFSYGVAGSTWPRFNRPAALHLVKHWTSAGAPPSGFLLYNRF
jgi:hypothetical protein